MKILNILLISSVCSVSAFSVEIKDRIHAIELAGEEMVLTQEMTKDYAMIGMNSTFGNPEHNLSNKIELFSDIATSLEKFVKKDKCKKNIGEIKKIWSELKEKLKNKPEEKEAIKIKEDFNKILELFKDLDDNLVAGRGQVGLNKTIELAEEEAMLSQKMAAIYMYKVWNLEKNDVFHKELEETMKEFKDNLVKIKECKKNTKEINEKIKKVERSFKFFEMMGKSKSKFIPSLIYRKSNEIWKNMEDISKIYVEISEKNGGKK